MIITDKDKSFQEIGSMLNIYVKKIEEARKEGEICGSNI